MVGVSSLAWYHANQSHEICHRLHGCQPVQCGKGVGAVNGGDTDDDSAEQLVTTHVDVEDPIVASLNSGTRIKPGNVQLVIFNNNKPVSMWECKKRVMLELTASDYTSDRPGLDLVAIMDVSRHPYLGVSKYEKNMETLKTTMRFVIRKLSPIDRLSMVAFSSSAAKLCPLRQITEASRRELEDLIERLGEARSDGPTNINDALLVALSVLATRKVTDGRVVGIVLISCSKHTASGRASNFNVGKVPVYTFGLGWDSATEVLRSIAAESMGGTFSHVQYNSNDPRAAALTMALSQCLAGLLTVAVQSLELTVATVGGESTIVKVTAGSYTQAHDAASSVTVSFGDLYSSEVRNIIVDLRLPSIGRERGAEILKVTYSYRSSSSGGQRFVALPETLTTWRTGMHLEEEIPAVELQSEEARLQISKMIQQCSTFGIRSFKPYFKKKLEEAQNMLVEQSDPLFRTELQELSEHSDASYALSSESSHNRQRYAARGNVEIIRLFATPRMDMYLEQAKKYLDDPAIPLPSSLDDDVKEESEVFPDLTISNVASCRLSLDIEEE